MRESQATRPSQHNRVFFISCESFFKTKCYLFYKKRSGENERERGREKEKGRRAPPSSPLARYVSTPSSSSSSSSFVFFLSSSIFFFYLFFLSLFSFSFRWFLLIKSKVRKVKHQERERTKGDDLGSAAHQVRLFAHCPTSTTKLTPKPNKPVS